MKRHRDIIEKRHRDIIAEAKSVGINPTEIANEIQVPLGKNTPQTTSQVLTSEEVDQAKRSFVQNIYQFLKKYEIVIDVEIGFYSDTRHGPPDGCSVVIDVVSSSGIFERYPDGNIEFIELSKLSVEDLFDPVDIFCDLIQKLTFIAKRYKSQIKKFKSALKSIHYLAADANGP